MTDTKMIATLQTLRTAGAAGLQAARGRAFPKGLNGNRLNKMMATGLVGFRYTAPDDAGIQYNTFYITDAGLALLESELA